MCFKTEVIMMKIIIISILFIVWGFQVEGRIIMNKHVVYQRDFSEHCRRKVIPSVFLGKNNRLSHHKLMLFKKSDIMYNCFISIRAELGSDIIVVIQAITPNILDECNNGKQLVVYEMGETFGGYWGSLAEEYLSTYTFPPNEYVLNSTDRVTTPKPKNDKFHSKELTNTTEAANTVPLDDSGRTFIVEVPLVNISAGNKGYFNWQNSFNYDEFFGVTDDNTKPPYEYVTTEYPILEVSVAEDAPAPNDETMKLFITKPPHAKKPDVSTFGTKVPPGTSLFDPRKITFPNFSVKIPKKINPINKFLAENQNLMKKVRTTKTSHRKNEDIEKILAEIRNDLAKQGDGKEPDDMELLDMITKSHQRKSYEDNVFKTGSTQPLTAFSTDSIRGRVTKTYPSLRTILPTEAIRHPFGTTTTSTSRPTTSASARQSSERITSKSIEATFIHTSGTTTQPHTQTRNNYEETHRPIALVGHESWENLVHVAPEMHKILTSTPRFELAGTPHSRRGTPSPAGRRRRYVQAVDIENARPHSVSPLHRETANGFEQGMGMRFMLDLEPFIEPLNDHLMARVNLRNTKRLVGQQLYSLCENSDPKLKQVLLFNRSRIVLHLANFTMHQVAIVATAARVLQRADQQCPDSHLECQVGGARVCISSVCACDGVPNCGSYDIYDEDRIQCKKGSEIQQNVCLAAFMFLAVLGTVLYILHYWLKRCVPKVSQAFFIFADGAENFLNLESVMRSPNDDTEFKFDFSTTMNYEDEFYSCEAPRDKRKSIFRTLLDKLSNVQSNITRTSREKYDKSLCADRPQSICLGERKNYSFTEMEIKRMAIQSVDTGVQTGSSLEMQSMSTIPHHLKEGRMRSTLSETCSLESHSQDELDMLRAVNKRSDTSTRRVSVGSTVPATIPQPLHREKELRNVVYRTSDEKDRHSLEVPTTSMPRRSVIDPHASGSHLTKKLRFEERTTAISKVDQANDDDSRTEFEMLKDHGTEGSGVTSEDASKDFGWFWKKGKKKSQGPSK